MKKIILRSVAVSLVVTLAASVLWVLLIPVFHFNENELRFGILATVALFSFIEPFLRIHRKDTSHG